MLIRMLPPRMAPLALLFLIASGVWSLHAAPTPAQRRQVEGLNNRLVRAGKLFSEGRFQDSAAEVQAIGRDFVRLADTTDPELLQLLQPLHERLTKAHEVLKQRGIELPELKELPSADAASAAGASTGPVSFVGQVAPLLVSKCGRCHVDNARGEFSMATYAQLMKGSSAGVVIFKGDDMGSRLIEVIETGDMPRGGGKLTAAEFALLKRWVKEGAKFDGTNEQASLRSLAPQTTPAQPKPLAVARATGSETVSFARDIAPVLATQCIGCHVNPQNARGNLNMTTFAQLLRGGDSGPPLVPQKPADSLLIRRLKGEGGDPRMPRSRPPLDDSVIAKFEKWIAEGATFDGRDPRMELNQVAALGKAQAATHEELTAERRRLAQQNWRLGMPSVPCDQLETENFLLLGNVGEATLKELGKQVEAVQPRIADLFDIPTDQPLVKGRMTLFVFAQRYDYSEFGQMVERRQIPPEWRGHWQYTLVDAYAAVIPSRKEEYSFEALVAQQIAGTYLASLGKETPRWFAEGGARVVASRIAPRDPRVAAWDRDLPSVLAAMTKADDFLTGKLPAEQADIASYSFVKALMVKAGPFRQLLDALRSGQEFESAFAGVYRATPAQLSTLWAAGVARNTKRKR